MEKGLIWSNEAGRQHLMSWLAVLTFDYWTIFPFPGIFLEYILPIFLNFFFGKHVLVPKQAKEEQGNHWLRLTLA